MNLRDLWDNVVLRDILGYIFPGAVTLLALAILLTRPGSYPWRAFHACSNQGMTGLFRVFEEHPLLVFPVGAACYAIGHLQFWIIEWLERAKKVPTWDIGKLALAFLRKEGMGKDYARAGLRLSKLTQTSSFANEPMIQCLSCSKKNEKREPAERQAEEVWRLCDRYVLHKDKDMHGMFIGRYYVLAMLFTNLGISLTVITACALLVYLRYDLVAALGGIVILILFPSAALHKQSPTLGAEKRAPSILGVPLWSFTIVGATILCASSPFVFVWPIPGAPVLCASVGVLMVMSSSHFRRRFVERTFPIFYAIVQAEERSKTQHARE